MNRFLTHLKGYQQGLYFYKKLSRRERIFTMTGGIGLILLLVYFLGVSPMLERIKITDRLILKKEKDIEEMVKLKQEYDGLKERFKGIETRLNRQKGDFSLLSFIEGTAQSIDIRNKISSMRPQPVPSQEGLFREDSVELRIKNISLPQIVEFLKTMGDSPHYLRVKLIKFKTRYSDPSFLDVTLIISNYRHKKA